MGAARLLQQAETPSWDGTAGRKLPPLAALTAGAVAASTRGGGHRGLAASWDGPVRGSLIGRRTQVCAPALCFRTGRREEMEQRGEEGSALHVCCWRVMEESIGGQREDSRWRWGVAGVDWPCRDCCH